MAARLGLAEAEAAVVLDELVALGYVERYQEWWRTTTAGNALTMARATRPVPRAKAKAELEAFLARVGEVNASERFLCRVEEVVLFGSFLDPAIDHVGDVDVAVTIRLKPTDANVVELSLAHARASGRRFVTFTDELFWPEMEVRRYLKAASRVVSMTTTDDAVLDGASHRMIYSLKGDTRRGG